MRNQRGSIKPIICIILLFIAAYVGYKFAVPYYRYYSLKSEARSIARLSYATPVRYRDMVYERAEALNIPIEPSDIFVAKKRSKVEISTSWTEVVDIFGQWQIQLEFNLEVEE